MPNIFLILLFNFLKFLDKFLLLLTNKSFLISLKDKIEKNSYKEVEIFNKKIIFFIGLILLPIVFYPLIAFGKSSISETQL